MKCDSLKYVFSEPGNWKGLKDYLDCFFKIMQPVESDNKLFFCLVQVFSSSLEKPSMYLHNRFPLDWQKNYATKNYHLVDPSWAHAKHSTIPFFWSDLKKLTDEQKAMVDDAKEHGLNGGVLVPFHGRAGYSLLWIMSSLSDNDCRDELVSAKNIAYDMFPFVYESVKKVFFGGRPILSKREAEVLYWVAEGLRTEDVSQKLCISAVTVEKHIANSCKKLDAKNRTQCVRMAVNLGLLIPRETCFDFSVRSNYVK